jgi:FixJ family two-component response regulator
MCLVLLRSANNVNPQVPVVILTGLATIEAAVKSLKEGDCSICSNR